MRMTKKTPEKTVQQAPTDRIMEQWQTERPDIDNLVMGVCGDIWHASETIRRAVLENLKRSKLDFPQFDVLMTLRRQGRSSALSPSQLAGEMMLSTSAMTNRLDKLEQRGLIVRKATEEDRRCLKISLTDEGFSMVDSLVVTHVETEEKCLASLSTEERHLLRSLLQKISLSSQTS